jgi:hypothetical protein
MVLLTAAGSRSYRLRPATANIAPESALGGIGLALAWITGDRCRLENDMKCNACGEMNCGCDKGGKCSCGKNCTCVKKAQGSK